MESKIKDEPARFNKRSGQAVRLNELGCSRGVMEQLTWIYLPVSANFAADECLSRCEAEMTKQWILHSLNGDNEKELNRGEKNLVSHTQQIVWHINPAPPPGTTSTSLSSDLQ